MNNDTLAQGLRHLVIFKNLRQEPLISALAAALEQGDNAAAADLAAELYPRGTDLRDAVAELLLGDDNFFVRAAAAGRDPGAEAAAWLDRELDILDRAVDASGKLQGEDGPRWRTEGESLHRRYGRMLADAPRLGSGLFARYSVFSVSAEGTLVPVEHPDPQRLSELYGYEAEREKLIRNTQALLRGLPANNVLLYGDAGTGKSSSVKALINEYYDSGLRMIEIYKYQFRALSSVIAAVKNRNYRFIIYIDDLSFEENEVEYKFLKAVIEGGVETRPDNVLIYATSNRRHLIKETWSDRSDMEHENDVHRSDTMEEKLSLAARFGVAINYNAPNRQQYHEIVKALAERQLHTDLSQDELLLQANRWEIRHGGISGRTAQQFINYLAGKEPSNAGVNG